MPSSSELAMRFLSQLARKRTVFSRHEKECYSSYALRGRLVQMDFEGNLNLRKATLQDIQELKAKLRVAIKKQHTARNVTLRDKISFVIGTTLAM